MNEYVQIFPERANGRLPESTLDDLWHTPRELQPAPARRSRFFPASAFEGKPVPARKWLVEGLIPAGAVTLLGGDGATGKTLVAMQLASSVALGRPWFGNGVNGGGAIFVTAEDDEEEIHRRLADIAAAEGVTLSDLNELTIRSLAGEDALLAHQGARGGALQPTPLLLEIESLLANQRPALLVLDPLADLFPGNENDRAEARQFIGLLRGLAIRYDCAVLLLAHPSLSGLNSGSGTSGSTAWNNSVRSRLYLERVMDKGYEPDPDARLLSTKKANYGRNGGEMRLRWFGGIFVRDEPDSAGEQVFKSSKAERVFMTILLEFAEQGRYVSASPGPTYAPSVFTSHPKAEGCTKRALRAAMEALFSADKVHVAMHGRGAKARSHIAEGAGK